MKIITCRALRELAGAVVDAVILTEDEGLVGVVTLLNGEQRVLGTVVGGEVRHFNSIDGVVSAMADSGVTKFQFDARNFISRGKRYSMQRKNTQVPLNFGSEELVMT